MGANNVVYKAVDYQPSASAGINEALAAMGKGIVLNVGHVLELPPGENNVSETIQFGGAAVNQNQWGLVVRGWGCGQRTEVPAGNVAGTVLKWTGASGGTMMSCFGVRHCRFSDFMLDGGGVSNLIGLDFRGDNSASSVSSDNLFESIAITQTKIGLRITGTPPETFSAFGGGDQVDSTTFRHLYMRLVETGVLHFSSQAVGTVFDVLKVERYSAVGFNLQSGYSSIRNPYFTPVSPGTGTKALVLGAEANLLNIDGVGHWELESGGMWIDGNAGGTPALCAIRGQSILVMDPANQPDLVLYTRPGKLSITNCRFDALNSLDYPSRIVIADPARLHREANVCRQPVKWVLPSNAVTEYLT